MANNAPPPKETLMVFAPSGTVYVGTVLVPAGGLDITDRSGPRPRGLLLKTASGPASFEIRSYRPRSNVYEVVLSGSAPRHGRVITLGKRTERIVFSRANYGGNHGHKHQHHLVKRENRFAYRFARGKVRLAIQARDL